MMLPAFVSATVLLGTLFVQQVASAPVLGAPVPYKDSADTGSLVKRQCVPNGAMYDDSSYRAPVEFVGDWVHLTNQGGSVKAGSLSYTGQANAMVRTPNPFPAGSTYTTNVTVWSTKKNDRGQFNVYIGSTLLGTGNQYTSAGQETATQPVFTRTNVQIEGGLPFVIKNDKGARFMAFDALELAFCNF